MLAVKITTVGFVQAATLLKGIDKGFPKAAADAINRGLLAGRTLAAKSIRAEYNIASDQIKAHINLNKASWGNLEGSLGYEGSMLPLEMFKPSVRYKRVGKGIKFGDFRQFVSVAVRRGVKKPVAGAFRIPDGRIMERRQPSKYPIFPVSAIGIPHMLGALRVGEPVTQRIAEITQARLMANVKLFVSQGQARWPRGSKK
jgi:hypothetical protein